MRILIRESQFDLLFSDKKPDEKLEKQINFISDAKEIHKDSKGKPLYDYSLVEYTGALNKVKIICPKHIDDWKKETGHIYYEMTPNHHTHRGSKCKFCYLDSKLKYSDKDIKDAAEKYKTSIEFKTYDFLKYNAARKKGMEFYKKMTPHFVGATESQGESSITNLLIENGLINEDCFNNSRCDNREKIFEDCTNQKIGRSCRSLRFDFYIPKQNTVIEFDGPQHFSNRGRYGKDYETLKQNDMIKNEYCKNKGIKLIRIHYKMIKGGQIESELMNALNSPKKQIFIGPY
jgi:very-short-patch-repair endonuclease